MARWSTCGSVSPLWVKVWFALVLAGVLPLGYVLAAGASLQPEHVSGAGRQFLGLVLALLVTGGIVGLPLFARWMARDDEQYVLGFLIQTLEADAVPSPRDP